MTIPPDQPPVVPPTPTTPRDADQRAFVALFSRDSDHIRAYLLFLLRNRSMADDAFQEVAITLWERFADYDPSRPFLAWARGVARFKALRVIEQQQRALPTLSAAALDAVDFAFERADTDNSSLEALDRCLERLPAPARQLLQLRYGEDLSLDVVAKRSRSSLTAVTKSLSRLRGQLEICIRGLLGQRQS
jgi:RNA polymerase sigma-70 factor (ECF subfamily)